MKIFLIGFMGSGKTHWGSIWAKKNGLPFFDLDRIIEVQEKKTIADIFELYGEDHFRKKETVALKTFAEINEGIVACGGGTPCFYDNMQWMNEHGTTVYLDTSPQTIYNRVLAEKDKRPLLEKVNKAGLLSFIEQKLKEREPFYKQAKIILSAEELDEQTIHSLITHNS
jgi:shikimate kinase